MGAKLGVSEVITIIVHFASVPDPRGASNARHHDILDILGIALCAVICGAEGFTEMEQFGQAKSNEITAVPALLKLLDLGGAIVTVDVLNCQKDVARQIVEQGGDYVFALKDNHRGFHEDVASYLEWGLGRVAKGDAVETHFASHAET